MPPENQDKRRSPVTDLTISGDQVANADFVGASSTGLAGDLRPGQVIGERYRIVGLLGRGGMGLVYRADDLELGASVALKFLAVEFASDPKRLDLLRREVRLARQISHPNVCRVYDIGAAAGQSFLTMEFIDGENLASLLRRIGHLPGDKAIELAREICAGVAAAHGHDLVHCDLKPANVMIDGRGHARLTDFGLAALVHDPRDGPGAPAGTPAYMAPEQLQGHRATKESDVYALGLVLYELFTGKPALSATTIAQLRELHSSSVPPTSPSELVPDLHPAVDQVIMRCLDPDSSERPPSALAVLAALPGGDPLRAVMEAGETPSPDLVAASGRRGTLRPKQALQLAAVIAAGLLVSVWISPWSSLDDLLGGILAPQILQHRAREILASAGYRDPPGDTAIGFDLDPRAVSDLLSRSKEERSALLRSEERPVLRFWYRQSAGAMSPWRGSLPGSAVGDVVTPDDPPLAEPGMALVRLSPRGRLMELRVDPGRLDGFLGGDGVDATLIDALLSAAGIANEEARRHVLAQLTATPGTTVRTWSVAGPAEGGGTPEIEAEFAGGRLRWFRLENRSALRPGTSLAKPPDRRVERVGALTTFAFLVGGTFVALLNIRSKRWDRRGAARLAAAVFVLCSGSVLIGGHHTFAAWAEARLTFSAIAYGASRAILSWLLYVAIEPFIRRFDPTSLVSWSRLLAGRVRDPAIGRDVLIGLAAATVLLTVISSGIAARGWSGSTLPIEPLSQGGNPLGTPSNLAAMMRAPVVALGISLGFLLLLVIARALLRGARAAAPAILWIVFVSFVFGAVGSDLGQVDRLAIAAVLATGYTYLAVRCGLLAFVVCTTTSQVPMAVTLCPDPTQWYAAATMVLGALLALLTAFGVRTSIAGSRLFKSSP